MAGFRKEFIDNKDSWRYRKWMFDDDGITIEEKWDEETTKRMDNGRILHCFCPYGNITKIEYKKHINAIWLTVFAKHKNHEFVISDCSNCSPHDMKVAFKFAEKQSKLNKIDSSKFKIFKEVIENEFDKGIYIMRCETCGQVFRYTDADLKRNKEIQEEADKIKSQAAFNSFFVSYTVSAIDKQRAENKLNTIRDYYSCPQCNSRKLKRISEKELKEMQGKEKAPATASAISSADELKKFKELLDSGIITQEEFDAKKKQLLGL